MNRFALLIVGMLSFAPFVCGGCSEEVAHSEKDKPNLTGGKTHEETTTYRNPDGTYRTENTKERHSY